MQDKAAFTPPSLLLATIALSLATFMQVLDTTIANVALPTIAGNLGVSSDQGPGLSPRLQSAMPSHCR
jgi:DHA2 family multidrug resistance protein